MHLSDSELFDFLESKTEQYNNPSFIDSDPIRIPHQFSKKEDIEIAGFLTATIAWGQRKSIIKNAQRLLDLMDNAPHNFILNFSDKEFKPLQDFKHRTFQKIDLHYFLKALQHIYTNKGGLEAIFTSKDDIIKNKINHFRTVFFELEHPSRTQKHVSNPEKGASTKRLNMFLRWMVRNDNKGVDFGIWKSVQPSELYCPLDVHSGNVARKLGILSRKQNDWKAVDELSSKLKQFDPKDPIKYDFALFGLGVFEKF